MAVCYAAEHFAWSFFATLANFVSKIALRAQRARDYGDFRSLQSSCSLRTNSKGGIPCLYTPAIQVFWRILRCRPCHTSSMASSFRLVYAKILALPVEEFADNRFRSMHSQKTQLCWWHSEAFWQSRGRNLYLQTVFRQGIPPFTLVSDTHSQTALSGEEV